MKGCDFFLDTYEIENYYTASEVAEILGLDKNTILYRCKKGQYQCAFKTEPNKVGDPHGIWLIPKHLIDQPHIIQDVATLTRQINPIELERIMITAITTAVTQAIEPLTEKLENQSEIIRQLQVNNESSTLKIDEINNNIGELTRSARKQQSEQESALSWWRVLLIIIFIIGIVFMFSMIFVNYFGK